MRRRRCAIVPGSLAVLVALATACTDSSRPPASTDSHARDSTRDSALGDRVASSAEGKTADLAPPAPDQAAKKDTLVPVGDAAKFPLCAKEGGICMAMYWELCPISTEPVDPDPHRDCGSGYCCVAAPASTCTSSGSANCFAGSCPSCWTKTTNTSLACESGRACCESICD
jgi:hypothetical protein